MLSLPSMCRIAFDCLVSMLGSLMLVNISLLLDRETKSVYAWVVSDGFRNGLLLGLVLLFSGAIVGLALKNFIIEG